MHDRIEALFDEFLGLALSGKSVDVEEFLAARPELADAEREQVRVLAQSLAGKISSSNAGRVAPRVESPVTSEAGAAPTRLGPFQLLHELGRGGQGVVYLALDTRLKRRVAVKVLLGGAQVLLGDGTARTGPAERLQREAALASKLEHPGICAIHEIGTSDGALYVAMRYVEGETLAQGLARARERGQSHYDPRLGLDDPAAPPPRAPGASTPSNAARERSSMECVRFVETIARAVHAAHEAEILHRDIKPANVMVTPRGEPVIMDFGLARSLGEDATVLTATGCKLGTPAYASPEQMASGSDALDRRTDVYSLGVVLYECLTLKRPFEHATAAGLYHQVLNGPAPDPRRVRPGMSRDLTTVIQTALEKDRERRYPTALALAEDLRRVREHLPILARPAGPLLRARRWVRRNRWQTVAGASVVGCASILALVLRQEVSESEVRLRDAVAQGRRLFEQRDGSRENFEEFLRAVETGRSIDLQDGELKQLIEGSTNALHGILTPILQRGEQAGRSRDAALADVRLAREAVERTLQVYPGCPTSTQLLRMIGKAAASVPVEELGTAPPAQAARAGLRVVGTPAFAEAWLFAYRERTEFQAEDAPRLVPVPVAVSEDGPAFTWPLQEETHGTAASFSPGDLALAVVSVDAGSLGESLGIRSGDSIVAFAGRRVDQGLVVVGDAAAGGGPPAEVDSFAAVRRLGSCDAPTEFERDVILGRTADGAEVEALVDSAAGPMAFPVRRRGAATSPRLAGPAEALQGELPREGVELVLLQDGRLHTLACPGGRRLGLQLLLTANPLVLAERNKLGRLGECRANPPPGSYLLVVRAAGHAERRIPFVIADDRPLELRADLVLESAALPGFVYVGPGESAIGEPVSTMNVRLRETIPLDGFWIARHEVTIAEYLPYLHSDAARLAIQEGEQRGTHLRVPRAPDTPQDWRPKCSVLPGWALRDGRYEFAGDTSLPIAGLACEDIDAYCAWLTLSSPAGRAGWYFRLPTKDEWERAARGADARRFVWGDVGNPSFCRGREARERLDPHGAILEPGLRFPVDESPFGVRDMTGNLFELCAGSQASVGMRPWCGGHKQIWWPAHEEEFLAAFVAAGNPTRPGPDDGFRIVAWLSEPGK